MSFEQSPILLERPNMEIITDLNYKTYQGDSNTQDMRGYVERDFNQNPLFGYAKAFSDAIIPESEWKDRIEYRVKTKTSLLDLFKAKNVKILNQKRLPYCWCYGPVGAMQLLRAKNNLPTWHLSATSAASKIKNYREVGGWGEQAIEGINKFGVSTVDYWPEAVNNRRYDTPEQRENAKLNMFTEVEELRPQTVNEVISSLLNNHPVSLALMWWGHLVYAIDVVYDRGKYMILIVNSWGENWSEGGMGLLELNRATPHEAFSFRRCTLSLAA